MRINDDQRREVAQELRELRHTTYYREEVVENICDAISIADPANTFREPEDIYKLIADLIDPQTTPYICEKCGGEWPSDIMFERCPYCGAEVIDD